MCLSTCDLISFYLGIKISSNKREMHVHVNSALMSTLVLSWRKTMITVSNVHAGRPGNVQTYTQMYFQCEQDLSAFSDTKLVMNNYTDIPQNKASWVEAFYSV